MVLCFVEIVIQHSSKNAPKSQCLLAQKLLYVQPMLCTYRLAILLPLRVSRALWYQGMFYEIFSVDSTP